MDPADTLPGIRASRQSHRFTFSRTAWTIETGNSEVIVAVCDAGFEWHHCDLRNVLLPGFDFGGLTTAYASVLISTPDCPPADCLSFIASRADPGGFDPFECLRILTSCSAPDSTWQPGLCDPAFLENPPSYTPLTDGPSDHGTKVVSIVGAERNNQWGIAGIAGGSGQADGVRILPLRIKDWASSGHPGVGISQEGDPIAFRGSPPAGATVILTPTVGLAAANYEIGLAAGASCLEYVTYMRSNMGVNIRVATFSINGNCQVYPTSCPEIVDRYSAAVIAAWDAGIFVVSAVANNGCDPGEESVQTMALQPYVFAAAALTMTSQTLL